MHPIFSHQRVCWHHCCYSNLGHCHVHMFICMDDWLGGSYLQGLTAAGVWSQEEKELNINVLKMKVVQLALNIFLSGLLKESIALMSNNATVVACLKRQGGTVSRVICSLAQEIMAWSQLQLATLTANYIKGRKSIQLNQLSHADQVLPTEWSSFSKCSMPSVRCMSSSCRLVYYKSKHRASVIYVSSSRDALHHPWNDIGAYMFPPSLL